MEIGVGLRSATSGTATVLGLDPRRDRDEVTRRVGVQPQEVRLFEYLSVQEILEAWASFYDDPRSTDELVERLALNSFSDRRVKTLSGGQRQRLNIALAMVGAPDLLVLDEPSAGLDPQSRRDLWSLLKDTRDEGTSVILSTHSMEEAEELCDEVAVIESGRCVTSGKPSQLIEGLGSARRVEFRVTASARASIEKEIAKFGTVTSNGERLVVETADSDRVVARLAAVRGIDDVTISRPSLRDVYFATTGKRFDHEDRDDSA